MKKKKFTEKPVHSKIELTKTDACLSIHIPPIGWHRSLFFIWGFAIFWNLFASIWTVGVSRAPFPTNVLFMSFSLPLWIFGIAVTYILLFCMYGQIVVNIDRQTVSYAHKIFGKKLNKKTIITSEIRRLISIGKHYYKDSAGFRQERQAELRLESSDLTISLGGRDGIIKDEATIDWLAYEISEWLDLPLTINNYHARSRKDYGNASDRNR